MAAGAAGTDKHLTSSGGVSDDSSQSRVELDDLPWLSALKELTG